MAVGDAAIAAGYATVPDTGESGRVRYGAQEINRTRDYIANLKAQIPGIWPMNRGGTGSTSKAGARINLGIRSGTGNPSGGSNGDLYFKIIT